MRFVYLYLNASIDKASCIIEVKHCTNICRIYILTHILPNVSDNAKHSKQYTIVILFLISRWLGWYIIAECFESFDFTYVKLIFHFCKSPYYTTKLLLYQLQISLNYSIHTWDLESNIEADHMICSQFVERCGTWDRPSKFISI